MTDHWSYSAQSALQTLTARCPWNCCVIRHRFSSAQLASQKFEDPAEGEAAVAGKLSALQEEIKERFRNLEEEYR